MLLLSQLPSGTYEIIAVAFGSETDDAERQKKLRELTAEVRDKIAKSGEELRQSGCAARPIHIIEMPDLPRKHAGLGLARKVGMDEAVYRLRAVGNEGGLILSLDAEGWLDKDALERLEGFMAQHPQLESVAFPAEIHDSGGLMPELDAEVAAAAIEADLRVLGLRQAGHPYAFPLEEVGFVVRLRGYEAQDGMNRRKFGDIFAFLQKFIEVGRHGTCGDIAVNKMGMDVKRVLSMRQPLNTSEHGTKPLTFSIKSYQSLANGLATVPDIFGADTVEFDAIWDKFPDAFRAFLMANDGRKSMDEMLKYSRSREAFVGRFFRWMDSLRTLRFLEYCAEHHWPKVQVDVAARHLHEWVTGKPSHLEFDGLRAWAKAEVRRER